MPTARAARQPSAPWAASSCWETSLPSRAASRRSSTPRPARSSSARSLVDHLADNPTGACSRTSPPLDYSTTDTRVLWCWTATTGCELVVGNPRRRSRGTSTPAPSASTLHHARQQRHRRAQLVQQQPAHGRHRACDRASPTASTRYAWTNQWFEQRCNPDTTFTSPQRNDIDAARANLFAMHNRMHDWSYFLGFTEATWNLQTFNFGRGGAENDPEHGNAQAGGVSGGPPGFAVARQRQPDHAAPTAWRRSRTCTCGSRSPAAFYAPCVDGDYDMSVIGHEYTHAISNRMVGGPNAGLSGNQAGAMGESWSDLDAIEYLHENGFVPVGGENPFAVGPYVTGDQEAGIRNYGMNNSPLNYSDVGYDFVCNDRRARADAGARRRRDLERDQLRHPAGVHRPLRRRHPRPRCSAACADGETPVDECPGNRRWIQLVFDAWLLMATGAGEHGRRAQRDAGRRPAALRRRRPGHPVERVRQARPRRRTRAATARTTSIRCRASTRRSPTRRRVRFTADRRRGRRRRPAVRRPLRGARDPGGRHRSRARRCSDTFKLVPGTYEFIARGNGFGATRAHADRRGGPAARPRGEHAGPTWRRRPTARRRPATASTSAQLIDDTEATNWASLGSPVAGKQVTVRLDPSSVAQRSAASR